jgi:hypothetical protein
MGSPEIPGEPQIIPRNGEVAYLIDGLSVDDPGNPKVVKFGILQKDTKKRYDRGQNSALAQFDGIVAPGLIMVQHIFRGLKRPLCTDGDMKGDTKKLVHTWLPANDFDWANRYERPRRLASVANCVFVVLISTNHDRHLEEWPEVYGWIDRWNWVYEDAYLRGAPLNWISRYEEKLFTREGG